MAPEAGRPASPNQDDDSTVTTRPGSPLPFRNIGHYTLIRKIGEGGMGVVYLARQLEPIRREVALKVIKPGMDSRQVIARFESERQVLALMDHPHIARVLDAGTTSTGLPYFVMEVVFGIPITQYCDSKRLSLRERIELFIPVCRAIQHAHQKGIIHRDIKPSNVLIAEREGDGVPKVIDFGLAKALSGGLSDATLMTVPGAVVGTLRYMSPEQAEPGNTGADTRSDVYSLGVLLYELAAGTTPLRRNEKPDGTGYMEMLQRIREEEPPPPSSRVRQSKDLAEIAQRRKSDPARYPGLLEGDLDWIVLKALEKERSRRYETANGLSRDLERLLTGEPVEAAPPSTSYRVRKLARKYRLSIATAAAFLLLLIAAVIVSSWMAVRATRAEREAVRERNTAKSVSDFLRNDLLAQASAEAQARPAVRPDPDLKVRAALDRAAARIQGKFTGQPLVEASIRDTIASSYTDLGLYSAAEPHVMRSLELRRRELGEANAETAKSFQLVGRLKWLQGNYVDAESYYAKTFEIDRRVLGEENPDTLVAVDNLASAVAYQGKWEQARKLFAKTLDVQRRLLGRENTHTLNTMNNLAATYFRLGNYAEAGELHREALEIRRRVQGNEHPSTLVTLNNLAEVYFSTGDYLKAEPLLEEALRVRTRVLGPDHPFTLTSVRDLGVLRLASGQYAEAEGLLTSALNARRRILGGQHPDTLISLSDLAKLRQTQRRLPEAEALLQEALAAWQQAHAERRADIGKAQIALAEIYIAQKRYSDGEEISRDASTSYGDLPETWWRYKAEYFLGTSLAGQKKFASAEPFLLSGYRGMTRLDSTVPANERYSPEQEVAPLVHLYRELGRPEEASKWQQAGTMRPPTANNSR